MLSSVALALWGGGCGGLLLESDELDFGPASHADAASGGSGAAAGADSATGSTGGDGAPCIVDWAPGCGDSGSPCQVDSCCELNSINDKLAAPFDQEFVLAADIDCSGVLFQPIGQDQKPFSGKLSGGHTIANLVVAGGDDVGLFGFANDAVIERIGLVNVSIQGDHYVGAIAGHAIDTIISESFAIGSVNGPGTKDEALGGLVGKMYGPKATLADSYARVTIEKSAAPGDTLHAGYLAGIADAPDGGSGPFIHDAYAVDPSIALGLLGAQFTSALIEDSYFQCGATIPCGAAHAKQQSELQGAGDAAAAFAALGWDSAKWGFAGPATYPCLQWEVGCD